MNLVQCFIYLMILAYSGIVCVTECANCGQQITDDVVTLNLVVREMLGRLDEKDRQLKEQSVLLQELRAKLAEQQTVNDKLEELRANLTKQENINDNQNERIKHLEAAAIDSKLRPFNTDGVIYDGLNETDFQGNNVIDAMQIFAAKEDRNPATHIPHPHMEDMGRTGKHSLRNGIGLIKIVFS